MKTIYSTIKAQFNAMLQRGTIPCFEFERDNNGSVEWFIVDIDVSEKGVEFSFDQDGKPCFFDGEIVGSDNFYCIPFEDAQYRINDNTSLDQYLELIHSNIIEGYLIPNNIMAGQDE
jgi:hypothetical protein